jgi:hypothetical protein
MPKKILPLIALTIALLPSPHAAAQETLPQPCLKSTLCNGLLEVYNLLYTNDSTRQGAFLGQLHEHPGQSVGGSTTKPLNLYDSLDLAGNANSYLWANGGTGFPASTAFWLYIDTLPAEGSFAQVLTRRDATRPGPTVFLSKVSGNTRLWFDVRSVDNEQAVQISSGLLSPSTWYHFVLGFGIKKDANGNPIGGALFLAQDGAAKTYSGSVGFVVHQGSWHFRIGQAVNGNGPNESGTYFLDAKLNQLAFWNRELTNAEISLLYNSGNGRQYPFQTE